MRRADRLFQLVQILRARRRVTGAALAERLNVSLRTVYRDLHDLQAGGLPIMGEAGVGYSLAVPIDVPPLLFSRAELVAIQFGLRMASHWGDAGLRAAAREAQEKIIGALPRDRRAAADAVPLFAAGGASLAAQGGQVREAVEDRHKLRLAYRDVDGEVTERVVWPLGLVFWGQAWTVTGWCELRNAFRDFRLDRVCRLEVLPERYPSVDGRTLKDYWRALEREAAVVIPEEWRQNHPGEGK